MDIEFTPTVPRPFSPHVLSVDASCCYTDGTDGWFLFFFFFFCLFFFFSFLFSCCCCCCCCCCCLIKSKTDFSESLRRLVFARLSIPPLVLPMICIADFPFSPTPRHVILPCSDLSNTSSRPSYLFCFLQYLVMSFLLVLISPTPRHVLLTCSDLFNTSSCPSCLF